MAPQLQVPIQGQLNDGEEAYPEKKTLNTRITGIIFQKTTLYTSLRKKWRNGSCCAESIIAHHYYDY